PEALAGVADAEGDLAEDEALRHREVVALERGVHHRFLETPPILLYPLALELGANGRAELGQRLVRPQRLGEVVVEERQLLLLHLDHAKAELTHLPPEAFPRVRLRQAQGDLPL